MGPIESVGDDVLTTHGVPVAKLFGIQFPPVCSFFGTLGYSHACYCDFLR
jgi:hypothetical protein